MLEIKDCGEYLTAEIKLLGGYWTVRLAGGSNYREMTEGIRVALKFQGEGYRTPKLMKDGTQCEKKGQKQWNCAGIGDSKIWVNKKGVAVIGVSVKLPSVERKLSGTLEVCTGRDTLILATKAQNERPFAITGDEVKKWISERGRRYYRLSQDRKSGKKREQIKAAQRRIGDKWRCRIDTYIHEITARIVEHAVRRKVKTIRFDGTIKSFAKVFPWFDLKTKLAYKCEDAGIEFVDATQTVSQPEVNKPHVYFAYSPVRKQVKIGKTTKEDLKRLKQGHTWCPDAIYLAIDNQPNI